jgi:uncharacterized protein (TIGR03437 family)
MQQKTMRMPIKSLKLILLSAFCLGAIVYSFIGQAVGAFSTGPLPSRTLAPALGTFPAELTCNACHLSFPLNSGPGVLSISGLPPIYMPGQEITVTVTVAQADRARYGFEAQVLDDQGRKVGDLVVTDAARTQIVTGVGDFIGRQYIEHTLAGVTPNGTNQNSWSFTWRAPAQSAGRVTFYVAGNAANGSNTNQGDYIYTISQSVQAAGSLAIVSSASLVPTGNAATESIMTVFGTGLADGTASATTLPLPTTLAGATVKVRDASGADRDAPLFFASPTQINFLLPQSTPAGVATVTVTRGGNSVSTSVTVERVAPTLFTANATGQGVAAAVAVRVRGGVQTFEPVVQFNATAGRFDPVPIDLGPEGDQVFLVVFGSGLRGRTGTNNRALIGGSDASVQFVGAQGDLAGLDQANILIPRSLAGRGNVDVFLTVDNRRANAVTINIK